jgi:hypothetical protein
MRGEGVFNAMRGKSTYYINAGRCHYDQKYDYAGRCTCGEMSHIHIMQGGVHAGEKHAGRHHRTVRTPQIMPKDRLKIENFWQKKIN